jgi:hypothetical protein
MVGPPSVKTDGGLFVSGDAREARGKERSSAKAGDVMNPIQTVMVPGDGIEEVVSLIGTLAGMPYESDIFFAVTEHLTGGDG